MQQEVLPKWVVAHTKPQQERWAAENVKRQGFGYYLPLTLAQKSARKPPTQVCLFPRYLFVQTVGPWRSLLSTYGIQGVVMFGESPAPLPAAAIEELKSREGSDGLVYLPNTPGSRYKRGESLRINEGPLIGYHGLCAADSGPRRVKVLLDFLGRQTTVQVENDWVEVVDE